MRENPVKKKLKEGKPSVGSFLIVDNPAMGEIMADVGFEWLAIDGEHAQFTIESMRTVYYGNESDTCSSYSSCSLE